MIIRRRRVHPLGVQQCAVVTAILAQLPGCWPVRELFTWAITSKAGPPKVVGPARETLGLRR